MSKPLNHNFVIVIMVKPGRTPERENPAYQWVKGSEIAAAELRAYEIAVAISEHIQWLGFDGKAHVNPYGDVDIERLSVMAGLTVRKDNKIINPFLKQSFALAVVTTNYELNIDLPLSESSLSGRKLDLFGSRWSGAGNRMGKT